MDQHLQRYIPGQEDICTTCVFGPGGHGEEGCISLSPPDIFKGTLSQKILCNKYKDILSGETKEEVKSSEC